jgi:hypothetical protein
MAPKQPKDIPISRALGRFVGHLWTAAAGPGEKKPKKTHTVRESTVESPGEIDGQPVILRRTTIEEVEFRDSLPPAPPKRD